MSNQWLAIDVATAPATRARQVRRAWERFVGGEAPEPVAGGNIRLPIADSWRRSAAAGVDPSGHRPAPVVADADEAGARWEVHPLNTLAPLIRSCLAATADESRHLIVVSDAGGVLLWVEGSGIVRRRAADEMNFAEGTLWSEGGAGTNAIGTALAARHAVQVFAAEHFNEVVQAWTCAAAPVHDPENGQIIGVIDLTGEMSSVHPHSMAVATATVQAVEAHLRVGLLDRDARLLQRHGGRLAGGAGPRAIVSPGGRIIASRPEGWLPGDRVAVPPGGGEVTLGGVILAGEPLGAEEAYLVRPLLDAGHRRARGDGRAGARPATLSLLGCGGQAWVAGSPVALRPRHAEILALLGARPEGQSSEELAKAVYGDASRVGAVRVEVSRLRRLIGDLVDPGGYRLAAGVHCDVAEVCGLLHRGRVREAALRYVGPLLPRSTAPGIVAERDALAGWLRQSVMSGGDVDALWAWLQSASGANDRAAWQRLVARLPFADPRRSLAAARIGQLRGEAGSDRLAGL
jgi:hypothetical protein